MSISGAAVEAEAEESCRSKSWRRSRWQSDDDDPGGGAVSPWPLGPPGASGGTAASSLRGSARGPEESSLLTSIFQSGGERERERGREKGKRARANRCPTTPSDVRKVASHSEWFFLLHSRCQIEQNTEKARASFFFPKLPFTKQSAAMLCLQLSASRVQQHQGPASRRGERSSSRSRSKSSLTRSSEAPARLSSVVVSASSTSGASRDLFCGDPLLP